MYVHSPRPRVAVGLLLVSVAGIGCLRPATAAERRGRLELRPCSEAPGALCSSYQVWEDRVAQQGRRIRLPLVVLPALDRDAEPSPIFWLAGGPGAPATDMARPLANSWLQRRHEIVLVDQRGTGRSNPLTCGAAPDGVAASLRGGFEDRAYFERCRDALSARADLRLYTTPIASDDLDEVREAMGYDRINLWGGSYGSRAALVFMRRHPERVRAAVLSGIAPVSLTNPLYHAREAQNALDGTFAECAADIACNAAFPDLPRKFAEVLERLATPVSVQLGNGSRGLAVRLDRVGFAEGIRTTMYYMPRARSIPWLVQRTWEGDYVPVAEATIRASSGIRDSLAMGMLLSVVCAEDIVRIDPAAVDGATAGTFLGDHRVRTQMAACEIWPRGEVPANYGEPVAVDVPTLLWSGTLDPVTGPRWGTEAARHLPRSLHLIVPGAHGVRDRCTESISRAFLARGTTEGLDTACVGSMRLPPFVLER